MHLLLVDGSNLILRHGFAQLRDLQIEHPEEAIAGVLRSAEHALRECAGFTGSSHAVIALDSDGASWRFATYIAYLGSPLWEKIRARVLKRDKRRCRLCPKKARQVHHLSYGLSVLKGEDLGPLASLWVVGF